MIIFLSKINSTTGTIDKIVEIGEILSSSAIKNFPFIKAFVRGPLLNLI